MKKVRTMLISVLPRDLIAYKRKAILKCVIPWFVLEALMIAFLIAAGDDLFQFRAGVGVKYFFYVILCLVPFFITGFPWKIMDRSFHGVIESVQVKTKVEFSTFRATRENMKYENQVFLTIRTANGKVIHRKVHLKNDPKQEPTNYFKEGETVFHLYGSRYIIVLPTRHIERIHCPVCDDGNDSDTDTCLRCGHSLIRLTDMPEL